MLYTEYLQQLATYSKKIDNAKITESNFIELQRLESKIINSYNNGYINCTERQILLNTYYYQFQEARKVLRVNEQIKQIDKEIRKARREEARRATA